MACSAHKRKREINRKYRNPEARSEFGRWMPTGFYTNRPWLLARWGGEIGHVETVRFVVSPGWN